jgi:hypothetical protein
MESKFLVDKMELFWKLMQFHRFVSGEEESAVGFIAAKHRLTTSWMATILGTSH